jgi:hypothetical protein
VLSRLRSLILRRRARAGIEFLRWMDTLMFVQEYSQKQRGQAWRDFHQSPGARRAVLDQLSVGLGIKIKRERKAKYELRYEKLTRQFLRLQVAGQDLYLKACWTTEALPWDAQAEMWGRLRDALGFAKGTATARGMAPIFPGATTPEVPAPSGLPDKSPVDLGGPC